MIATKFEEIYPPATKDFAFITDEAYSREEILQMETILLNTLDFNILAHSSYRFLERYAIAGSSEKAEFYFAQYLLELALLDSKMN